MRLMSKQALKERFMKLVFMAAALVSILAVALICLFLFANGLPAIGKIGVFEFLLGKDWSPNDVPASFGILPMIMGSIYVTAGAIIIGVPIGILTAVFMAKVCPKPVYKVLKPAVELLAGIPSVVYGFFGLVLLVPIIRNIFGGTGTSMLAASVLLGLMILPTVIGITETSIRAVPEEIYDGAVAIGASHERSVFAVVLPAAKSGVLSAVVLAIGRAIGETMAVIMVAGNQARMPAGILRGVRTLTANIVIEMGYAADLHREALIATGVVLFVFILIINLSFSALRKGGAK
jgi:phosphate transport system permease protein